MHRIREGVEQLVHLAKIAMLIHNPHHFRLIGIQRCIDKLTRTEKTEDGQIRSMTVEGINERLTVGEQTEESVQVHQIVATDVR